MSGMMAHWEFNPFLMAAFGVAAALYGLGLSHIKRHRSAFMLPSVAFYGGLALLAGILCSPLHHVAEHLFSAHMGQHLLIVIAVAPLLVLSHAPGVWLCGLEKHRRCRVLRAWSAWGGRDFFSWVRLPHIAWLVFTAVFLFWHLPQAFRWAQAHEAVHIFEHLSLLMASCLFWAAMFKPKRIGKGAAALGVILAALAMDIPSVVMIFASHPLYLASAMGPSEWGLTMLEDQQFAGLLMWVPGNLAFFGVALWLFAQWFSSAGEARAPVLYAKAPS